MAAMRAQADEPIILKTPGVVGGSARIRQTRIPVWVLVNWKRLGLPDAQLLEEYPQLTQKDLDAAWNYAAEHVSEIEEVIRLNDDDADV